MEDKYYYIIAHNGSGLYRLKEGHCLGEVYDPALDKFVPYDGDRGGEEELFTPSVNYISEEEAMIVKQKYRSLYLQEKRTEEMINNALPPGEDNGAKDGGVTDLNYTLDMEYEEI